MISKGYPHQVTRMYFVIELLVTDLVNIRSDRRMPLGVLAGSYKTSSTGSSTWINSIWKLFCSWKIVSWYFKVKFNEIIFVIESLFTPDDAIVLICLTESSMHRRNISHYGLTTLRSTVAFNMLQLVEPDIGDIIMDPMCGCGALPIEVIIISDYSFELFFFFDYIILYQR